MAKVLLLLVFLFCTLLQAAGESVLNVNSSLTPSSPPLKSSSSAFILSFRPFNSSSSNTTSLYLAISFAVSPDGHPAWVANRDTAVSKSATLTLLPSGELQLFDPSVKSSPIWSTATSNIGVIHAQLQDTGNLVLLNSSSGSLWQSFDHPTDTLLPGQNFTARNSQLFSGKRFDDFSTGRYVLGFNSSTRFSVLQLSLSADAYTPNPFFPRNYWDWPGEVQFLQFDQYGNISLHISPSSINSTLVSDDHGTSAQRRLTLDVDGNLRMYSWDQASAQWNGVWFAFTEVCHRVKQLCGNYGVCIYEPQPTCVCPPAFSAIDPSDLSAGCKPNTVITSCSSIKYVELEDTDFPYNHFDEVNSSTEEDCKKRCSGDCNCLAAVYWQSGDGRCWLKQIVQNGYSPGTQQHRAFLKISDSDPFLSSPIVDTATKWSSESLWQPPASTNQLSSPGDARNTIGTKEVVIIALVVVISAQALCFFATVAVLSGRHRRKLKYIRLHDHLEGVSGPPQLYTYEELEAATENFSQNAKIGAGGFGTVYRGRFQNGKVVAVKRLEGVSQQEKQFRAEIATIGRIHHINLLPLLGFCAEGGQRLLVYEYMERGSLDQILFEDGNNLGQINALDWDTRFQICLGVARGINYLHEECLDCIFHCDIKPQNILLDGRYRAKVADFGLAYLFSRDHTVKMSTIRGTRGYMAPEWVSSQPITAKADVYSYGMLIMEIVSGRMNYIYTMSAMTDADDKWCFPMWAYGRRAEEVVDARMEAVTVDWKQVDTVLKVAFACIQADIHARPPMGKVVQMLEGALLIPEVPRPSLFPLCSQPNLAIASSSSSRSSSSITKNIALATYSMS